MHNITTGVDIFKGMIDVLNEYNLSLQKLVYLETNIAPTVTSVIIHVKEKCTEQGNNSLQHLYFIHQQICSKVINIGHVLKMVLKL